MKSKLLKRISTGGKLAESYAQKGNIELFEEYDNLRYSTELMRLKESGGPRNNI